MFGKIARFFGLNSSRDLPFQVRLTPGGGTASQLEGETMTLPTAGKIPKVSPSAPPPAIETPCNDNKLGFIHRIPVVKIGGQEIIAHELMLNNSSALLAGKTSEALNLMHDEFLLKSLSKLDLSELVCKKPAFIRLSPAGLMNPLLREFSPEHLILAFQPTLKNADILLARCRELKSYGYHFALDDFSYSPGLYPFLGLSDYLRFSISCDHIEDLRQKLDQIPRLSGKILIAKNIESPDHLQTAALLLFPYCQGNHFEFATSPEKAVSNGPRGRIIELMNLLGDGVNRQEIRDSVKRDSVLAGKILRYANAPASKPLPATRSLDATAGGLDQVDLYRWLGVLLFSMDSNALSPQQQSIFESALLRGRLTELFGCSSLQAEEGTKLFITGLFSQLGDVFNATMANALSHFSVSEPISRALLHRDGPYAPFLKLAIACEDHDQASIDHHAASSNIPPEQLNTLYAKAVVWTHELQQSAAS
jgi:EAL and modified HD-GYP domain-containing signal transduction protein